MEKFLKYFMINKKYELQLKYNILLYLNKHK